MNDPKRPVRADFNRAADATAAWRERQKAALDRRERETFERLQKETKRKKREAVKRFWAERERNVEAVKGQLLLQKPGFALRMLPSQRLRESIAYYRAADIVRRVRDHEIKKIEREGERQQDAFLKEQEEKRELAGRKMREEFRERSFAAEMREERERDRGDRSR